LWTRVGVAILVNQRASHGGSLVRGWFGETHFQRYSEKPISNDVRRNPFSTIFGNQGRGDENWKSGGHTIILGCFAFPVFSTARPPTGGAAANAPRRCCAQGNSNSHGARPVHLIITMIKWIRTSRLSIKNSLSRQPGRRRGARPRTRPGGAAPRPSFSILSHTMHQLNSFRKSTPPQNRQLIVH